MTKDDEDALWCATGLEQTKTQIGKQSAAHLRRLVAENEAKDALLRQIALTSHCGGLVSMSEADALTAIRKLTLETFNGVGHLSESAIRQHLERKA